LKMTKALTAAMTITAISTVLINTGLESFM
jgi:hypothetical protein